jgi:hypothetical protein
MIIFPRICNIYYPWRKEYHENLNIHLFSLLKGKKKGYGVENS